MKVMPRPLNDPELEMLQAKCLCLRLGLDSECEQRCAILREVAAGTSPAVLKGEVDEALRAR